MSQLIKATITPFEAIHFKQNASLVSSDQLDSVRRQAIAKQQAFKVQNAIHSTSANTDYMTQVRRAFSDNPGLNPAPAVSQPSAPVIQKPQPVVSSVETSIDVQAQAQAAYTQDRGSFELRVAKGELSYVPALDMTVITSYPDVQFEYLGGFQYVPPSSAPTGENVNISL
ncbi:MAG: hypothetical protein IKV59_04235 [Lachnospiraceae bacterium]|nr:hypothetical protein [Lachnospiraceae bacterium]